MASTTWHCMRCRTPTATLQIRPQTLAWQERTNADLLMLESAKQTEYGAKAPKGQTKKVEIEERKRKKTQNKAEQTTRETNQQKKTGTKAAKAHFDTDIAKTQSNRSNKPSTKKNRPKTIARENCPFQSQIAGFSACTWSFFHHSPWTSTPWAPWPCSSAARPKANPHLPTFP